MSRYLPSPAWAEPLLLAAVNALPAPAWKLGYAPLITGFFGNGVPSVGERPGLGAAGGISYPAPKLKENLKTEIIEQGEFLLRPILLIGLAELECGEGWEGRECHWRESSCLGEKKINKIYKSMCNCGPIDPWLRRCGSPLRFDQLSPSQTRESQQLGVLNDVKHFSGENYRFFFFFFP